MIKTFVDSLPYCDDCPYWKTSYEEHCYTSDGKIQYREIRISCGHMAICERIFEKEKEKRASEEGII